jgi:RNA polymerase sigma-70 factor (ECF subfamily)
MIFRNDPALLVPFRAGEPAALATVYRHYARPVDGYLRSLARFARTPELGQASVVADLLQDVFVRAFSPRARLAYDGLREFAPYLNTIARNCFTDALRKRRKEVPLDLDECSSELQLPELQQLYEPKILAVLQRYLSELPPELQGVYEQRFVLGVSQESASATLGVSRRTLRTEEQRLRTGLRKALQLEGLLHELQGVAASAGQLQPSQD